MVRSFLDMVGYYSRFIPRFAEVAEPLRELLCRGEPFVWTQKQEASFERLKFLLSFQPLPMFDLKWSFRIATDASACVLQWRKGELLTVSWASRTLTPEERKCAVGEQEALSCVWTCEN